jgi:hypothetical protein
MVQLEQLVLAELTMEEPAAAQVGMEQAEAVVQAMLTTVVVVVIPLQAQGEQVIQIMHLMLVATVAQIKQVLILEL